MRHEPMPQRHSFVGGNGYGQGRAQSSTPGWHMQQASIPRYSNGSETYSQPAQYYPGAAPDQHFPGRLLPHRNTTPETRPPPHSVNSADRADGYVPRNLGAQSQSRPHITHSSSFGTGMAPPAMAKGISPRVVEELRQQVLSPNHVSPSSRSSPATSSQTSSGVISPATNPQSSGTEWSATSLHDIKEDSIFSPGGHRRHPSFHELSESQTGSSQDRPPYRTSDPLPTFSAFAAQNPSAIGAHRQTSISSTSSGPQSARGSITRSSTDSNWLGIGSVATPSGRGCDVKLQSKAVADVWSR